uniref:Uncharacterized protein n=1 Tax=Salix viminalis TaxID=40686 RepID=A0A6N2NL77_SALVM
MKISKNRHVYDKGSTGNLDCCLQPYYIFASKRPTKKLRILIINDTQPPGSSYKITPPHSRPRVATALRLPYPLQKPTRVRSSPDKPVNKTRSPVQPVTPCSSIPARYIISPFSFSSPSLSLSLIFPCSFKISTRNC